MKQSMRRSASDNTYLHKDFHGAMSTGIDYLDRTLGEDAVREYLRRFARRFYASVTDDIRERGLVALKEHFERIYGLEGGRISISISEDELTLEVEACPAVLHMREHGYKVARLWAETERTVNAALCEGTSLVAELVAYDEETGRSVQRFSRRRP